MRTRPHVVAVFSSTRLPGFSGRDFHTTTGSSATSHRVSSFLSCLLKSPTDPIGVERRLPDDARLPQLLCWLPVDDYVLNHLLSLFMYRASCLLAHSPRQPAESGSLALRSINLLSLPSDSAVGQRRPCESDSLPHEQGEATCCRKRLGLPASLGKPKTLDTFRYRAFSVIALPEGCDLVHPQRGAYRRPRPPPPRRDPPPEAGWPVLGSVRLVPTPEPGPPRSGPIGPTPPEPPMPG